VGAPSCKSPGTIARWPARMSVDSYSRPCLSEQCGVNQSANTPRLAVDTSAAVVVAREYGWQKRDEEGGKHTYVGSGENENGNRCERQGEGANEREKSRVKRASLFGAFK
jgi:hypothetical protein